MAREQMAKLTMMANQIAQFFRAYPHDEAVAGVAHHIDKFWTPKMRDAFHLGLHEAHGGVDPLVLEAMEADVGTLRNPLEKIAAGPGKLGEAGAADSG